MKKLVLFLSALVVLASCQKKDYATFQKTSTPTYAAAKKAAVVAQPVQEVATIATPVQQEVVPQEILTASASNEVESIMTTPTQSDITNTDLTTATMSVVKTTQKQSFKNKVISKVIEKQLKKATLKTNEAKGGWGDLNKQLRLGIILTLAGMLLFLIPIIGWILSPIVVLVGLVFLILGLIKQFS